MKLLVVTQKVDREDENLGAFYYWFEMLGKRVEELHIISDAVGMTQFSKNVHVYGLGKDKGYGRMRRLWKFWELFSHYYARTDAVLFHQIPEFVLAAAPFLISCKRTSALWYAHGTVSRKLKIAERLMDAIVTSSEAGFRLPSKKVFFLGQAINTDLFRPDAHKRQATQGLRLVTIGRIAPVKNYETLIHACALLKHILKIPWSLSIVGGPLLPRDRDYMDILKKIITEKNLASYVHFQGARPYSEIPELLRDHDFFLNVSATGSLDKAVLEAMACGLTVLTSNEAYKPIVPSQYFLVSTSPEFIAERIRALAHDIRPNNTLREIVVVHHSLEGTIGRMINILQSNLS